MWARFIVGNVGPFGVSSLAWKMLNMGPKPRVVVVGFWV